MIQWKGEILAFGDLKFLASRASPVVLLECGLGIGTGHETAEARLLIQNQGNHPRLRANCLAPLKSCSVHWINKEDEDLGGKHWNRKY
ncbi:hypothetical protein V6N13_039117 [Hibiscus sabdariffa]|uniref:Uncharacterized protein n=1 Tax=Hibiscus sabdariffa TaxID=183260 RepID=A0ABR2SX97_9ROSI